MGKKINSILSTPLISIIVTSYNREQTIMQAIQSLMDQSFKDFEVILIDDGSYDNTKNLMTGIKDKRLHYCYQVNQGISRARNKGISLSQGEWIAFLDSDDTWLPEKLEYQLQQLEKEKTLWAHTEETWIRNGVKVNQKKKHKKFSGRIYIPSLQLCIVSPSSVLIHKSIFQSIGVFDPLLPVAEDYDLWLRISSRYDISFQEKPLIKKTGGHKDQLSRTFIGMDRFRVRALKKQLTSTFLNQEEREATREMFLHKCRILHKGYVKHGKKELADYYKNLLSL